MRPADPGVHSRDPQCWLTGQAEGVAGALAAAAGVSVADLDVGALQAELRRQGVYLQAEAGGEPDAGGSGAIAGGDSSGAMAGGPGRGPKVSITADTPALWAPVTMI